MSPVKIEAIKLIMKMPDVEVDSILETLRKKAIPVDKEEKRRKAMEGLKILEKYMGRLPADFDYKKELEEYREERRLRYENLG